MRVLPVSPRAQVKREEARTRRTAAMRAALFYDSLKSKKPAAPAPRSR